MSPLSGMHRDPSDLSDLDNIKEVVDNELQLLLNTHDLGKVRGTEVMETFGLSDMSITFLSLLGADKVMVDDWNHHPQRHPS